MTEREALKLALDAFGEIAWSNETQWQRDRAKEAIAAMKEALAQPEQDWIERERAVGYREGHRAALAQRTWVGLTDEEVKKIVGSDRYTDLLLEVVNFVEAKLKEKNT